ncbi:MAG: exodeoxyribonuclease III [Candidatus Pacebacteria bacterium]|nr:exodeoxyribonuclease III [Candidatus Paceibacterota bacterium]MCD8563835.1 exodeoxyribonuclease III [Candidatus Paceibacterota bacterium]
MKILSWNVNGIRSIERNGDLDALFALDADIYCLQEIKAEQEQLSAFLQSPQGMYAYFHSSQERRGYSGTAIYSRIPAQKVMYGLPNKDLDRHGRTITAHFDTFILVNSYFPNGASKTASLEYKLAYYAEFLKYIKKLNTEKPVILTGDFNVAHTALDLARPKENKNSIGFLPEERAELDKLIALGWVDVFRALYPDTEGVYTYWDQKSRAKDRNVGWRIDYFFVPAHVMKHVQGIETLRDHEGSDHVPLVLDVHI